MSEAPYSHFTALVTGASSGIGLEIARELAARGFNLVLVARSADKLEQAAEELRQKNGVTVTVLAKDLGQPGAAAEIHGEMQARNIRVDALVNNAGFGSWGFFVGSDLKSNTEMIQLNITALTELTQVFAQDMVFREKGWILNVASVAAFQPGPTMAVYYATKAYVLSFSEAIANELRDKGVTVTALCPGPTRTAFVEQAGAAETRLFKSPLVMDVGPVARLGVEGMLKGKSLVIPGFLNKFLVFTVRLTPRFLVTQISRMIATKA